MADDTRLWLRLLPKCVLPDNVVFAKIIGRVKDIAVGPDGLPYSAYAPLTELSAIILSNTTKHFATDQDLSDIEPFNDQFVWFALKGELDEDNIAVYRTAGNLRTIFGGNSDSKYIAAGISDSLLIPTLAITPPAQRGFCRERQLSLNVVDIDTHMRAFNILSGIAEVPSDDADEPLYQNLPSDDAAEPLYQNGLPDVANALNIDDASNAADDSIPIKSGLVPAADSIPLKSGRVPASECAFSAIYVIYQQQCFMIFAMPFPLSFTSGCG